MEVRLTATFFKDGDWWVASVPEIPGVNTQGATLDEARENLLDALLLVVDANRELAERELAGRSDVIREELTVVVPATR